MSLPMFKNLVGIELSDEEMGDIPHPDVELATHVTIKTVQAGSVIGSLVLAPAFHLVNYLRGESD